MYSMMTTPGKCRYPFNPVDPRHYQLVAIRAGGRSSPLPSPTTTTTGIDGGHHLEHAKLTKLARLSSMGPQKGFDRVNTVAGIRRA